MLVSVVVCTHNRAALIADTLASLAEALARSPHRAEVLVIDNASTDATAERVRAFQHAHPDLDLTLIPEPRVGLSHARNTGLARARGEIICFIDDDVVVPAGWLEGIVAAFALAPNVGAVAGRILLRLPEGSDERRLGRRERLVLSACDYGDADRILPPNTAVVGANCAFHRDAVQRVGAFDPRLGRHGAVLLGGEESDYARRVWAAGFVVAYAAAGYLHHLVPAERLTTRWFLRRNFWDGYSSMCRRRRHRTLTALRSLPSIIWHAVMVGVGTLTCLGRLRRAHACRLAHHVGRQYGWFCSLRAGARAQE